MAELHKRPETLAALGLAVSKLVHEIANPLNTMSCCIQELGEMVREDESRDRVLETIDCLGAEIDRLKSLLEEVRDLARPLKLDCAPVSLVIVVAEVVRQSVSSALASTITITKQFPEDLPFVIADREKLKQVLMNLIKNAIEAMPAGGSLMLRGYRAGDKVYFEIEDTGLGIDEQIQVFDLFATSKAGGWGLGLNIARQIMTAHQGTIDYTSRPGHGTTFRISLPAGAVPMMRLPYPIIQVRKEPMRREH